jgi:ATP synthase protein I
MFIAVGLQVVLVSLTALGAALWFDWIHAWSVALGGATAFIPNGLFALRLAIHRGRDPESYPAVFFLGEFAKIGLTIALLALVGRWVEPLSWPALVAGFIVALKAPLFAMLWARER